MRLALCRQGLTFSGGAAGHSFLPSFGPLPLPGECMSDKLTPIPPARAAQELAKLSAAFKSGELNQHEYEHKFARMVSELRDRQISGTRAEIMAALEPLRLDGTVTPAEGHRFVSQLGLG